MEAVILCGGQSSRMGRNKAFLLVEGRPLIERQIEALRPLFDRILLATPSPAEYEHLGLDVAAEAWPGRGSMVGIYSGLRAVTGDAAFFVACDMPFLNTPLVRFMVALSPGNDVVVPRSPRGLEPAHAIFSKRCLGPMEAQMAQGDFKIIHFFPQVVVREVTEAEVRRCDSSGLALVNINTPGEYARFSFGDANIR